MSKASPENRANQIDFGNNPKAALNQFMDAVKDEFGLSQEQFNEFRKGLQSGVMHLSWMEINIEKGGREVEDINSDKLGKVKIENLGVDSKDLKKELETLPPEQRSARLVEVYTQALNQSLDKAVPGTELPKKEAKSQANQERQNKQPAAGKDEKSSQSDRSSQRAKPEKKSILERVTQWLEKTVAAITTLFSGSPSYKTKNKESHEENIALQSAQQVAKQAKIKGKETTKRQTILMGGKPPLSETDMTEARKTLKQIVQKHHSGEVRVNDHRFGHSQHRNKSMNKISK
ncbi:MAG: hypothetical protein IPP74_11265 [Alphaproteobacteria bacterium]|nr:hypothetical protein [Alphaproteobacteria bacterium]